ncbi:MAG: adenylate/guanylate cyclase domain-containing protein [Planctomycetota bacterium]
MGSSVEITIWRNSQQVWTGTCPMPLELGRQRRDEDDASVWTVRDHGDHFRLPIAPIPDLTIPRLALQVDSNETGNLEVQNIHPRLTFHVGYDGTPLGPGQRMDAPAELIVTLPDSLTLKLSLVPEDAANDDAIDDSSFRLLPEDLTATMAMPSPRSFNQFFGGQNDQGQGIAAVDLVRQALAVVQKSAGSGEFFDAAVRSAAGMVALDRAYVLLRDGNQWVVRSKFVASQATADTSINVSSGEMLPVGCNSLLQRMLQTNQTVLFDPNVCNYTAGPSMLTLDRAVATPIRGESGDIIGTLYGDRKLDVDRADTSISDLEATLLEIMAGAVSAGLARQKQEAIRAAMTQFFSPTVTEHLEHNEDLLSGRDAEVSVLFCDIRGFSRICERVGPQRTFEWINDVLTRLSQCVMETDGVLVDYVGDELMAMWGAPGNQPDHAIRACRSACAMLRQIEPLREAWLDITPDQFGVGIGINTGAARVGNTGSKVKFKYGPLGNTVNMASRIQGITRKMGVEALITESTLKSMRAKTDQGSNGDDPLNVSTRRLAEVRPFGVDDTVHIYELCLDGGDRRDHLVAGYEAALQSFESLDTGKSMEMLEELVRNHGDDAPTMLLQQRVRNALRQSDQTLDPILTFNSK